MSLEEEERMKYEEQYVQAVNFLSFELERVSKEFREFREETREKRLQEEETLRMERIWKEKIEDNERKAKVCREESESEVQALRDEMSTMRKSERRRSVGDRMRGNTIGSWLKNISKDDHFSYGVFFVFGTLKMILSERVRHDDQGTAMVRVLSFSKNETRILPVYIFAGKFCCTGWCC